MWLSFITLSVTYFVNGLVRESCVTHAIKEWINGLGRSMQIYLPVHFLPAMFFRFQQLQGAPVSTTARISYAALCSSAFLTSYQVRVFYDSISRRHANNNVFVVQTVVKLVICTARNAFHRDFAAASLAAGVSQILFGYGIVQSCFFNATIIFMY